MSKKFNLNSAEHESFSANIGIEISRNSALFFRLRLAKNAIFPAHKCSNANCLGWSGGAMVLGKLPVPGRPTIWIIVGQVGAGGECLDIFLSSIFSLFLLPLSGRSPHID